MSTSATQMRGVITIAVAVEFHNKGSQFALKWATDQIAPSDDQIIMKLIHVKQRIPQFPPYGNNELSIRREPDIQTMDSFLPFRCFCLRRKVECEVVVLEGLQIANALVECINHYGICTLVLGAPSRNGLSRLFKASDTPSSIIRMAPDFCNVYVISKGKIATARPASRLFLGNRTTADTAAQSDQQPNTGASTSNSIPQDELSTPDVYRSFISSASGSGRRSTDSSFLSFYQNFGSSDLRSFSQSSLEHSDEEEIDTSPLHEFSSDNIRINQLSYNLEEMEHKETMLEVKLRHTMEMYNTACKETRDLQQLLIQGAKEVEEERSAKEKALKCLEEERGKAKKDIEEAEIMVGIETQKRKVAEMKARKEEEEKKKILGTFLVCLIISHVPDQLKLT